MTEKFPKRVKRLLPLQLILTISGTSVFGVNTRESGFITRKIVINLGNW